MYRSPTPAFIFIQQTYLFHDKKKQKKNKHICLHVEPIKIYSCQFVLKYYA